MELAEFKRDVWGREVLLGVSWDWLWVILALSLMFVALHAIFMAMRKKSARPSKDGPRVQRHAAIDRAFHWIMAISVLVLLITGVLPVIGVEFDWLTIHWIAGLVLTAAVLFHLIRSVFWQDLKSMWISPQDLKEPFDANQKPGKYSLAQKGLHAAVTVLSILVIGSGLVLFAMIDTPWWDRTNALSEATLGWMFFAHGITTLLLIATISLHVYFGVRPEKLFYLRSMISGWVSRDELETHHDATRWSPDKPQ
ncbi:MAG: cytochrome b/b6 domain-containing protein [Woeseia sp.]|nr:cytochrome b/b6 domain-containing protein [Woeseia sp.]